MATAYVSGCSPCVTAVCAADPYCCGDMSGHWDTQCVSEVAMYCANICHC
jgi:hypothetical protein